MRETGVVSALDIRYGGQCADPGFMASFAIFVIRVMPSPGPGWVETELSHCGRYKT